MQEPALLTHHAVGRRDSDARGRLRPGRRPRGDRRRLPHRRRRVPDRPRSTTCTTPARSERAGLLQQLSYEQYMTSQLSQAIDNVRATFPLWQRAGDAAGLAGSLQSCAVYEYYSARRHGGRDAGRAGGADRRRRRRGRALRARRAPPAAILAYLRNDVELALSCALRRRPDRPPQRRPRAGPAHRAGAHADRAGSGDVDARARLADADRDRARNRSWDELASTGYSQLAYLDVEQRRFRSAEHVLDTSLPFAAERDIPICHHWQIGRRARACTSRRVTGAPRSRTPSTCSTRTACRSPGSGRNWSAALVAVAAGQRRRRPTPYLDSRLAAGGPGRRAAAPTVGAVCAGRGDVAHRPATDSPGDRRRGREPAAPTARRARVVASAISRCGCAGWSCWTTCRRWSPSRSGSVWTDTPRRRRPGGSRTGDPFAEAMALTDAAERGQNDPRCRTSGPPRARRDRRPVAGRTAPGRRRRRSAATAGQHARRIRPG